MKKLLFILLCLCGVAYGQRQPILPMSYPNPGAAGAFAQRSGSVATLFFPASCGIPNLNMRNVGLPAIAYDSCNHKVYFFDPTDSSWSFVSTGGLSPSDTVSLSNRINLKIDSITKNATADSFYYFYNHGLHRALKDSISSLSFQHDTVLVQYPLTVAIINAYKIRLGADTGRAVSQLVTGGSLKKVADSLGALIGGGGFTGWDDMLAQAQPQTATRQVELQGQDLVIWHDVINGTKALQIDGGTVTISNIGGDKTIDLFPDSIYIHQQNTSNDTAKYKPAGLSSSGGLVRMDSWGRSQWTDTLTDGAITHTGDVYNNGGININAAGLNALIATGGVGISANGNVFDLRVDGSYTKFVTLGEIGFIAQGRHSTMGDIDGGYNFNTLDGDDAANTFTFDNAAHNTLVGINKTPIVALDVVGDFQNVIPNSFLVKSSTITSGIIKAQDNGNVYLADWNGDVNGTGASIEPSTQFITMMAPNGYIFGGGNFQVTNYGPGAITSDGSGNWTSVSDRRAKHNIIPFNYGLSSINKLKTSSFIYNKDTSNTLMSGFIAQDVQAVIPIGVHKGKDGLLSLETNAVLAASVNAIKELSDKIDILQAKVNAQAKEMKKLKAKMKK